MYRELVRCQVLEEKTFVNPQFGGTTTHVVLGPNCHSLMSGQKTFDMEFAGRPEKTPKAPKERTRKRKESATKPEAIEDSDDDLVDMPQDSPSVFRTERPDPMSKSKDSDCISAALQDILFNRLMTVRQEVYDKEKRTNKDCTRQDQIFTKAQLRSMAKMLPCRKAVLLRVLKAQPNPGIG